MPEPDRDKTNVGSGLSLGLISPSPPHGQDTRGCRLSHLTKRRQRPVLAGSHACTGLPDRQTGTRQVEWLVARTQPAHSKIPAFPSAEATASATPRLTGCRGLWDMPGHRSAFGKQARSHRSSALSFEAACDLDTATRVHDHHEEATPTGTRDFPGDHAAGLRDLVSVLDCGVRDSG